MQDRLTTIKDLLVQEMMEYTENFNRVLNEDREFGRGTLSAIQFYSGRVSRLAALAKNVAYFIDPVSR